MEGGGWKRVALGGIKERFVQKKGFWFVKMEIFCVQRRKVRAKEVFVRKKAALSEVRKAFCKPRTSTPQPQFRTATIKTFLRKFRGFANLDSANQNSNFPPHKN